MMDYTLTEMMAVVAAREIRDKEIVFCGTGISMLAAMAAKHISAPRSVIFFETGAIDSLLEEIPLAVADSRVMYHTALNGGLADAFATMQNPFTGPRVVGILGAAQIDPFGNLNSTAIFRFDEKSKRMYLAGYYPGIKVAEIMETVEFPLDCNRAVPVPAVTDKELQILRQKCDPQGLIR